MKYTYLTDDEFEKLAHEQEKKYGYRPRDQAEAEDIENEAEALRNRKPGDNNCLFTILWFACGIGGLGFALTKVVLG